MKNTESKYCINCNRIVVTRHDGFKMYEEAVGGKVCLYMKAREATVSALAKGFGCSLDLAEYIVSLEERIKKLEVSHDQ